MKRFFETAAVVEDEAGFGIELDGKPLRTPGKKRMSLPTRALAAAIAEEWNAQAAAIKPDTMPLTKLASTALDHVAERAAEVAAETVKYAGTDLLCYRAEGPDELTSREARAWQPVLDWATLRFDAPLKVTAGVVPASQPEASLKALHAAVAPLDALALTAVADLTQSCGSLILALAIWDGRLEAADACAAAMLDETYQAEQWGEDAEAMERRRRIEADIHAAARFLELLR